MSRRILVTGATGLIGKALVPALAAGPDEVVPCGRSAADLPGDSRYHRCDLSDPGAARQLVEAVRPDAVVHLAGGTAADRWELYRGNVLTTVHLLEAMARLDPRLDPRPYCLVFGSAAEYGDVSEGLIDEASPLRPVTEYGRAKAAQTALAEGLARLRGIPLTILRPFNIVAPDLPPSSALGNLRRQLLAAGGPQRTVHCGRLDIVRDFVPLAGVVEAVRRLLAGPAPGRVINVCTGLGIELGEILDAMGKWLGVELRIVPDPALAALPAVPRAVGNPAALREATGLAITPTPESLARLLLE